MRILLFILCVSLSYSLFAQKEPASASKEERTEATNLKDETRKGMFNDTRTSVDGALAAGGAYYVSNPSPTYEVDMQLAYHNPEWQTTEVRMINGDKYEIKGRYRIIDQAFEVLHEGDAYELKKQQLQSILIGEDHFLMMPDPMLKRRGAVIYQLHYASSAYQLIEYHGAQWQEPKETNMFDTSEKHRTIKPMKELILRVKGEFVKIKNHNEAIRVLGVDKKSTQGKYLKKNKLKLNHSADLVQFLEYLDAQ